MKKFFAFVLPYVSQYKLYFFYSIVGTLLTAGASSLSAYLVQPILDDIFIRKDQTMLFILPFFVVIAYFAKGFGNYVQVYYMNYIGQDIIRHLKSLLLGKMLSFEMDFFNRYRNGELISRVMSDVSALQGAVSSYFIEGIRDGLTIAGLLGVVIYQSSELAFYGLIVMPLALYPVMLIAKKMREAFKKMQEKNADISSRIVEIFNNIELIKSSCSEKMELERFHKENKVLFDLAMKTVRVAELTSPLMETLGAIAVGVVIIVGGQQVIADEITPGAFFSFVTALFLLYTPLKRLSYLYSRLQVAFAAGDRIFEIVDREAMIIDGGVLLHGEIREVAFLGVGLCYGKQVALQDISLKLKKGESVAFVGDSGGGKSSLVNILLRLYDPTFGEVRLNQQDIRDFTQESLREKIAIVTQRIFILNDTVANNIAYGREVDEEKIWDALSKAQIDSYIRSMPQGIHTPLDEFGANLSGGQRQRIAIARAIYKDPEVLILDEATSALDNKTEEDFREALKNILPNRITIIVAHRFSTISLAQKIYFFKAGRIIDEGSLEELVERNPLFREFYKPQQEQKIRSAHV